LDRLVDHMEKCLLVVDGSGVSRPDLSGGAQQGIQRLERR
jgi:hypothetical protein